MAFSLRDRACLLLFSVIISGVMSSVLSAAAPQVDRHSATTPWPPPPASDSRKFSSFPNSACTTPCHSELSCNLKEQDKLRLNLLPVSTGPHGPMVSMSAPASPRCKLSGLGKSFGVRVTLRDTFLQFEPESVPSESGSKHHGLLRRRNSEPDVAGLHTPAKYNKHRSMTVTLAQVESFRERSKQLPSFSQLDTVFDCDIIDCDLLPSQENKEGLPADDDEALPSGMVDLASIDVKENNSEKNGINDDDADKTTVMIRHLPRHLSQQDIIHQILAPNGFLPGQVVDFFYAPINFKTLQNAGYCFVNFREPDTAHECFTKLNSCSGMADTVSWARVQGCEANKNHYKSSPIMKMIDLYKPKWFSIDGNEITLSDDNKNQDVATSPGGPSSSHRKSFSFRHGTDLYLGANGEVNRFNSAAVGSSSCPYKLFIGGLDSQTNSEDLRKYFSQFGDVTECIVKKVEGTGISRGFGFCSFSSHQGYTNCLLYQSWHQINGRSISVQPYSRRRAKRC